MIYLFSKDSTKARPLLSHTSTNNNYFDDFKMLIRDINTTFHERSEDRIVRRNVTKYVAQTTRRRIPRDFQPLRLLTFPPHWKELKSMMKVFTRLRREKLSNLVVMMKKRITM